MSSYMPEENLMLTSKEVTLTTNITEPQMSIQSLIYTSNVMFLIILVLGKRT